MTRPNSALVLRRASERLSAGAAALAVTFFMFLTCDVRAESPEANPPSVTVKYQGIAFDTADGAASVYRTLKTASRKVCGMSIAVSLSLERRLAAQACFDKTLADAVRRIDRPMLTAVHTGTARKLG